MTRVTATARALVRISSALSTSLGQLSFSDPVTHVYDPTAYAARPHRVFLERFTRPACEALLLGMNPGPFGMAQTGVPFGEVALVRDWMGIEEPVERPEREHPKRPIQGFACPRSEVSGSRLWSWVRERYGTPEAFFERYFVWNFCPLVFMEESGRNCTPDKLLAPERAALYALCDEALRQVVEALSPRYVIGIGKFAEKRARQALGDRDDLVIGTILHPSPASPLANRGWAPQAEKQLNAILGEA